VARSASDEALQLLDRLMTQGHNPAHLARQLVRLLRNTLVAKVAGENSQLLQISADERARAARVAGQFSEEDLARFLQIMLRTYDELGYRQEQRFHLELGVLKLVHAQRILPLEQVLSQMAAEGPKAQGASRQAAPAPPVSGSGGISQRKGEGSVSPFEVDRARKGRSFDPEMAASTEMQLQAPSTMTAVAEPEPAICNDPARILWHVLNELETAGHKMLASTLEAGSVELADGELTVTIPQQASLIPVMMTSEAKQIANAAAGAAAGRPIKVNVVGGATAPNNGPANGSKPVRNGVGARSRAAEEPVVQRMREKFGAEIRTVIDHREKN
jgi:DNA polymerase III subunit gamma/tau